MPQRRGQAPAARGRALARIRAAGADHGAARLFIAYPFVRASCLSVTDSRVGVPGQFVGLANFYKIWNDSIFRTSVYNTFLYTGVDHGLQAVARAVARHAAQPQFPRQGLHPRLHPAALHHPTVLSTFAWKWMFDPTFSVLNWLLYHIGAISGRINWLGDPISRWSRSSSSTLARRAVLRHQSARRPANISRAQTSGGNRRAKPWARFWYITWPLLLP